MTGEVIRTVSSSKINRTLNTSPAPPREVGEILHATGEMESAVAGLTKAVASLATRLDTALAIEPPVPQVEANNPPSASELGGRLRKLCEAIERIGQDVTQLEGRVQL